MCKLILIPTNKASFDVANLKKIIYCMPAIYKPTLQDLTQFQYGNIVLNISESAIDATAIRMHNSLGEAFSIQYG